MSLIMSFYFLTIFELFEMMKNYHMNGEFKIIYDIFHLLGMNTSFEFKLIDIRIESFYL